MKRLLIGLVSLSLLLSVGVVFANPGQDQVCENTAPWTKDESAPFEYTAPTGFVVEEVCVKGGQNKIYYTSDPGDACWKVEGIGTEHAVVTKIGSGSSCKDISHVSFRVAADEEPPTTPPTQPPTAPPTEQTSAPTVQPQPQIEVEPQALK